MKDNKDIKILLAEGEGYRIEFKENIDNDLDREFVAFANSSGGKILLGVRDDGSVKGIVVTNRLKAQIFDIGRNCEPPIIPSLRQIKNILLVEIAEGNRKPYQCRHGFFIRVGASTQKMRRDDILKFVTSKSIVHFDEEINYKFNPSSDLDVLKVRQFFKAAGITISGRGYRRALENLGLCVSDRKKLHFNNAAILMFARSPEKFFRQSFITCVLYKGVDKSRILDRKDYKGDLIYLYNEALTFLKKHLNLEYVITDAGPRREIYEIPEEGLREALLNAIIHRDYYDNRTGIFVEIFDDRVSIVNKGGLLFDKKYFGRVSIPRNPVLFDLFYRLRLIEKVGSGINRIQSSCKEKGINVIFEMGDFFVITFYRKITTPMTTQKTTPMTTQKTTPMTSRGKVRNINLTELESKILRVISKKEGKVSQGAIAGSLRISINTVREYVKRLRRKKVLARTGTARDGRWVIKI